MARPFDPEERARIQAALQRSAEQFFIEHGLKAARVEDIARSAGISKGAFYAFFPSKEELFLTIQEQAEAAERDAIDAQIEDRLRTDSSFRGAALVRSFLDLQFEAIERQPLFRSTFWIDELRYLAARVGAERMARHVGRDDDYVLGTFERWYAAGLVTRHEPARSAALVMALFYRELAARGTVPEERAAREMLFAAVAEYIGGCTAEERV